MKPVKISSKGFTLFEILVALTVLSLVALAALKAGGNAVNTTLYLKEQTLAHWVAMNINAEMKLDQTLSEAGSREGIEVMAGTTWPWSITDHQTPDPDFQRLEISVWCRDRQGSPLTNLTVYQRRR